MATRPEHLQMSDEDFLNQPAPTPTTGNSEQAPSQEDFDKSHEEITPPAKADEEKETNKEPENKDSQEKPVDSDKTKEAEEAKAPKAPKDKEQKAEEKPAEPAKEKTPAEIAAENALSGSKEKTVPEVKVDPENKDDTKTDEEKAKAENKEAEAPNYENLYNKIMAPFTANGKKIELKDPNEAIQLMQMGANYTRKLQELAPHRKIVTMLGNHGLLDETKLNFLISLDKKDPEAIKKLIIDSGIDPLDIDTKIQPAYHEGSYQVTDEEVAFRTTLEDLGSSEEGKQTLTEINKWDQASKDMLWQHPEIMPVIKAQRDTGIYTKITEEIDRQKTLGQILPTTPFLEAYKSVGDQLDAAGAFNDLKEVVKTNTVPETKVDADKPAVVVATDRAPTAKPIVDNGDKAGAASPTRTVPGKAKEAVNFLSMSDDDFIKAGNLQGRV